MAKKTSVSNSGKTVKGREKRLANLKPWRRGQSGNPGGRPKGRSITAEVNRLIAEGHDGEDIAVALAQLALERALAGDINYWREFVGRHEGRIQDRIEADTDTVFKVYIGDAANLV